jgi:hypothetical protein
VPRYYFNHRECGVLIPDEEGIECDAGSFRQIAINEARDIMSGEVKQEKLCLGCRIDVLDEQHKLVLSVPFAEAVAVTGV